MFEFSEVSDHSAMTDQLDTGDQACDLLIDTGMLYLGGDELPEPRQTILCSAERNCRG